jgi:hypothetical protein
MGRSSLIVFIVLPLVLAIFVLEYLAGQGLLLWLTVTSALLVTAGLLIFRTYAKRSRRALLMIAASSLVILTAWWLYAPRMWFETLGWGECLFQTERWKLASVTEGPTSRICLTRSLVSSHKLDGLSADDVIGLLGYPEMVDGIFIDRGRINGAALSHPPRRYDYDLGYHGTIDPYSLVVLFDEHQHVSSYYISCG